MHLLESLIAFTTILFCQASKKVVIIDSDPGLGAPWTLDIDDDFALIFAMRHHDVRLISTTKGCSTAENTYENAKRLMRLFHEQIPIASTDNAVESIVKITQSSDQLVTWIGLGPTTHFAKALKAHPEIKHNIDKIVILGGDTRGIREFNFWNDINSTNYLLNADIPLYDFPADRTFPLFLTSEDANYLLSHECSNFFNLHKWRIFFFTHFFTFHHRRVYRIPRLDFGTQLWDVTPVLWITFPEYFDEFDCFKFNGFMFTPSDCTKNSIYVGRIKNKAMLMDKFLDTMCNLPNVVDDGRMDGVEILVLIFVSIILLCLCKCACFYDRKVKNE